jgi:hypothetical protein
VETAAKILITGGTLNLALAFGLGFALSRVRLRDPQAPVSPYLQVAHRVALWEGFMLLGLTFAVQLARLSADTKTIAAVLLVASSVFQDGSSILNWLQGVKDEFAERSPGFTLATINAALASVGLLILVYGVFRAL